MHGDKEAVLNNFVPEPGRDKSVTLNRSQKNILIEDAKAVKQKDDARWSALRGRISIGKKVLLVVAMLAQTFVPAIGQLTQFVDPGDNATSCTDDTIEMLRTPG